MLLVFHMVMALNTSKSKLNCSVSQITWLLSMSKPFSLRKRRVRQQLQDKMCCNAPEV